ncbi:MAG: glycoside hydrolase family 76, partial [Pedobacter sp.]
LDKGAEIYRFMMTAYDTTAGGGLYWEEGKPTKNTCSNGPGILLALQLHLATNEKSYLDTALMLYEWTNKNLQDGSKLYLDNINTKTGKVDGRKYSYNTGTMLQANVYLYEITNEKKYLDRALEIADAAVPFFYGSGKFKDNLWFNAVMLRGFIHLRKHNTSDKYLDAFRKCTENELRTNKNKNGLIGVTKLSDLVGQGGMTEILVRFANLPVKKAG